MSNADLPNPMPKDRLIPWAKGVNGKGLLIAGETGADPDFHCWAIRSNGGPHHAEAAQILGVFERMEDGDYVAFVIRASDDVEDDVEIYPTDSPLKETLEKMISEHEDLKEGGGSVKEDWTFA